MRLKLGTRGSALARRQADTVAEMLRRHGTETEIVVIETTGDRRDGAIANLGAQGVFTREIQRALIDELIDVAVHSLKDLPTDPVEGLALAAVPPRGPVRDVFLSERFARLDELPPDALVGTGSLRRRAQLLNRCGARLRVENIRGNLETRLSKLARGDFDALILAEAGLQRLGLESRIREHLEPPAFLPAVGQGALGLEARDTDTATRQRLQSLDDPASHAAVLAERAMLKELNGGCIAPIAAWSFLDAGKLVLHGRVIHPDGHEVYDRKESGSPEEPERLGRRLAKALLEDGAESVLADIRRLRPDAPPG